MMSMRSSHNRPIASKSFELHPQSKKTWKLNAAPENLSNLKVQITLQILQNMTQLVKIMQIDVLKLQQARGTTAWPLQPSVRQSIRSGLCPSRRKSHCTLCVLSCCTELTLNKEQPSARSTMPIADAAPIRTLLCADWGRLAIEEMHTQSQCVPFPGNLFGGNCFPGPHKNKATLRFRKRIWPENHAWHLAPAIIHHGFADYGGMLDKYPAWRLHEVRISMQRISHGK
jgi:hypothetical protein